MPSPSPSIALLYRKVYTKSSVILHEKRCLFLCSITRIKVQKHIDITRIKVYYIITARESESGRSKRELNQERHIRAERDKGD